MDFDFPRGDTKRLKFILKDKNGNILSLSNADRLFMTVKKDAKSSTVVFQKKIGNGIVQGEDGYYYITINSSDTSNLNYGSYGYDIELKTGEGIVKTLGIGTITLTEEFTFSRDEV